MTNKLHNLARNGTDHQIDKHKNLKDVKYGCKLRDVYLQ